MYFLRIIALVVVAVVLILIIYVKKTHWIGCLTNTTKRANNCIKKVVLLNKEK